MTDTTATDTTATDTASIAPTSTTAAALSRIRSSTWARPEDGPVDPQTLLNIVDALAELESLDEQLEKLIEIMSTATVSDRASLFLYDKPSDELYIRAAHGGINELRLPSNAGIVGHVFSSGESVIETSMRMNASISTSTKPPDTRQRAFSARRSKRDPAKLSEWRSA